MTVNRSLLIFVLASGMMTAGQPAATGQECGEVSLFDAIGTRLICADSESGGCADGLFADPACPVTFEASLIQYYQGVADGGVRRDWEYAGSGAYQLGADLGALGLMEGLSVRARAEHRYGDFVSGQAGVLLPPALDAATPVPDSEHVVLLDLVFTQVLNENVSILFGKIDTLDGDYNPFASGRGRTGFMNASMLLPVNAVPAVPFSTLGAGMIFSVDGNPAASLLVLNSRDTISTSGFSELFEDGAAIIGSVNLPLSFTDQLGIHTFSCAWNSGEFSSLGQDPRVILPSVPIARSSGTWVAWWSGAQYLQQFDPENDPMKGWGLFGRFGVSDDRVAPIALWANAGIGGHSPICGRHDDRWGIGWFYNNFSSNLGPIAEAALNVGDSSTGVELFYNFAVNEHVLVTPDLQVIEPGRRGADTALVLGVRAEIRK